MSAIWKKNMLKLTGFLTVIGIVLYLRSTSPTVRAQEVLHKNDKPADYAVTQVNGTKNNDIFRGMALQISYTANGVDQYIKAIDEIADLGANTIGFSTAGYQEHAGSSGIVIDARKCPSSDQFRQLISHAKSRGLRVVIMPVLLLSNPRGSEWRGVINPPDWDEWFSSYLEFIKYFARIGLDNDVDALAIGAELVSTESYRDRWIKIIDETRKIYHGKLFYSSNWDHYKQVTFWDHLDWIGMTTYHKLADNDNPPHSTLMKNWNKIKNNILTWQKTIRKPIFFTEVGWCSQPGASVEAWNYYRHQSASKEGLEEQKKCYEAFMECWQDEKEVVGAMWWEWTLDGSGPNDFGYTPKGKPAEKVLRVWYQQGKSTRQVTVNPSAKPAGDVR
jgi:hypothetical protein